MFEHEQINNKFRYKNWPCCPILPGKGVKVVLLETAAVSYKDKF